MQNYRTNSIINNNMIYSNIDDSYIQYQKLQRIQLKMKNINIVPLHLYTINHHYKTSYNHSNRL